MSLQAILTLCVTGKTSSSLMWYPSCIAHPDMTLQHDNATSHTARSVRYILQYWNVSVLPWAAKSLDLNHIEHVWDLLDGRVRARAIPPRNLQVPWWNVERKTITFTLNIATSYAHLLCNGKKSFLFYSAKFNYIILTIKSDKIK